MHRLHVKIFLWFWLGVVVVSGTLVTLTELTHSRAEDDRHWREKYGPRVDLWARQETHILRTQGLGGARRRTSGRFRAIPASCNYIFDAARPRSARAAGAAPVPTIVASLAQSPRMDAARRSPHERIIAEKVIDANGNPYVVVVDFPGPSILTAVAVRVPVRRSQTRDGSTQRRSLRLAAVLGVAGHVLFRARAPHRQTHRPAALGDAQDRQRAAGDAHRSAACSIGATSSPTLGHDFNRMADGSSTSSRRNGSCSSDVSHALRSPLARLNVALGLARRHSAPGAVEASRSHRARNRAPEHA